jgi:hypothetical protein
VLPVLKYNNYMLVPSIISSLNQLLRLLEEIADAEYTTPCTFLSNSSIGEHTRHIVEMFQCLEDCYDCGLVNYDNRKRNKIIETETVFAISQIRMVQNSLEKGNKKIDILQIIDGKEIRIESNYHRELLYNLEHCIHHQALIKVAVLQSASVTIDENFGVARSTIEYRIQCAQ